MRMPWGKYRGDNISEISASYLAWVLEECDNVKWDLRHAIQEEMADRFGRSGPLRCQRCDALHENIREWFRKWSFQLHPDRGGSDEAMRALNDINEELKGMLRRI